MILGILFAIPCIAFSAGGEVSASPPDFPSLTPNAAISVQSSEFGPERVNVTCFGTGKETVATYKLFQKFYGNGEEVFFDITPPQPTPDFTLFMKSWDQCDIMVAGYDENGDIIMATPEKHIDISRFNRKPASTQPQPSAERFRSASPPMSVDASQFPLIRIHGALPEGNQPRSAEDSHLVIEESGVSQDIGEHARSAERPSTDILLLVSNSASMNYNAPWFMPKLQKFLRSLAESGMDYRIGLIPFGSADQTAAYLKKDSVFYKDAAEVSSVLENRLPFDSPYDDAVSAVQTAVASAPWNSSAKKVIILAGNQVADADRAQSREIVAEFQKQDIRCFTFLPEQSFLTQLLTRRTGGSFLNFYNDDLTTILSDLNPSASSVSFSYQTDQLTGQGQRKVSLYYAGTGTGAREKRSQPISFTYTPPTPFDLMLVPATEALVKETQNRREPMAIQAKVMKQDPDMPAPALTLHYRDSGKPDYKAVPMTRQDEERYVAAIPAEEMAVFGINYYITGESGDYQVSLPPRNPEEQPLSVAVFPNYLPSYRFDLPEETLITGIPFSLPGELHADQQVVEAVLYYRAKGETEYAQIRKDFGSRQPEFEFEIPDTAVTSEGVEYYMTIRDSKGTIKYAGDMTAPMYAKATDPATMNTRRASRQSTLEGDGFNIWADEIVPFDDGSGSGASAAIGNIFIGKTGGEPMVRYEDVRDGTDVGILLISPDKKKFSGYGTLFASQIATRRNPDPYDEELYKGSFIGTKVVKDDLLGSYDLSLNLQVTPDNETVLGMAELAQFSSRFTSDSKIAVDKTKVIISGSGFDFSLSNDLISFPGYPGFSKASQSIWARDKMQSTSKETFSLETIKLGIFNLASGSVTIDLINWGLEISAGGFLFGKLMNVSSDKHPKLAKNMGKGFIIGVQINPPALTRLKMNLPVPAPLCAALTVPGVTTTGIPVGVAPTGIGLDIQNLGFGVPPPSFEVSLSGKLNDNLSIMKVLETFTGPLLAGNIMLKLDLSGTLASKGEVTLLSFLKLGGYYGHVSVHSPQLKFKAYANRVPMGPASINLNVEFEGGYKAQRVFFAGSGGVGVGPPLFIVSAAKLVGVSLSNLVDVKVSASGAAGSGTPSLKVAGQLSVAKYPCPRPPKCDKKCKRWGWNPLPAFSNFAGKVVKTTGGIVKQVGKTIACVAKCVGSVVEWKDFKIGATVTLLPKMDVNVSHRSARYRSEPGVERVLRYADVEGEQVPALVEFHYGSPVKVFPGNEEEVFSDRQRLDEIPSHYYYHIPEDGYELIMVRVISETGVPQVEATMSWAEDDAETAITYNSLENTDPNDMDDDMVFSSSEENHETLGIIKAPVSGFYVLEILNPDEVGNVEIQVTVPNQPPSLEITSVRQVGATDTEDILEVTYTLTDPDTEDAFVTFRLSDEPGKTDTALFLFPEGISVNEPDSEKLIGNVTEKTVRLMVDRALLKSDTYRVYGQAEDGATAPVVQWGMMETSGDFFELTIITPGAPDAPENLQAAVTDSGSGVLVEWDARPTEENVVGYTMLIQNLDNSDESYKLWADGGTANAKEVVGLTEGQTYRIELFSVNEDYLSSPDSTITFTPVGLTRSGSPDLTVDLENSVITRRNQGEDVTISVTVTNIGSAASTDGKLEVCYGKYISDFAVTPEEGEAIGTIGPGETKTFEYSVSEELLTALKDEQPAEKRTAADFSGIFKITDVEPNELADGNNSGMVEKSVNEGAVERTITLHEGWNMVALPVDAYIAATTNPDAPGNTFAQIFGPDAAVWIYRDGEWNGYREDITEIDPHLIWDVYPSDGLWVHSPVEKTITMEGWPYDALKYYTADDSTFKLLGTGEAIDNPLAKFKAADPDVEAVWTMDSEGNPVQNPSQIEAGEGFWVSKSATEPPTFSEPSLYGELEYAVMILKLLAGISELPVFSIGQLDLTQDGFVGVEDAIFGLQQASLK